MLKKYSELSEWQRRQVGLMYADTSDLTEFTYNFDEESRYHGRQRILPKDFVKEPGDLPEIKPRGTRKK